MSHHMLKHTIPSPVQPRLKRQASSGSNVEVNSQQQYPENDQGYSKAQKEYELDTSKTWFYIGQCASSFELYSLAIQAFDSSLRHVPDNFESLIGLSKCLKLQDPTIGLKQSAELLQSSLQRYPHLANEPLIWKELCETHLESKQFEEAHQAISRALSLNGNDPDLLLVGATCLIKLLNYQYATHTLHSVLSFFANKPHLNEHEVDIVRETHYKLAYIASLENNLKVAISEMQTALSLPPQSPSKIENQATLWAFLITLKERSGDIEDALRTAHDAINSLGSVPKLLIANAYLLLLPNSKFFEPLVAVGLLESAVNQEILTHGPNAEGDFLIWYLLGKAHSAVDSPREAYDAFQIALRIGPASPLPWLAVGSLYLKMGQLPDALAAYSQAARLLVDETSVASAASSATAWDGLSCVYERCDDQANDAADACLRAAACFRAAGDLRAATQSEQRAHSLTAGARGEAPVPSLRGPPETPIVLLRELIVAGSKQSTKFETIQTPLQPEPKTSQPPPQPHSQAQAQSQLQHIQNSPSQQQFQHDIHKGQQRSASPRIGETPKQFHHIPIPRGSLASRSNTPEIKTIEKSALSQPPSVQQPRSNWSPRENAPNGFYFPQPPPNVPNPRSIGRQPSSNFPHPPPQQQPQPPQPQQQAQAQQPIPPQAVVVQNKNYPVPAGPGYLPPQTYGYASPATGSGYSGWR